LAKTARFLLSQQHATLQVKLASAAAGQSGIMGYQNQGRSIGLIQVE
jgi:hypothetical protein